MPSTTDPIIATNAMNSDARSDDWSASSAKNCSYHRVLNPPKLDSDFLLLKLNRTTTTIGR